MNDLQTKTQVKQGPWIVIWDDPRSGGLMSVSCHKWEHVESQAQLLKHTYGIETQTIIPVSQALAAPEMFEAYEGFAKGWTHFCDCIDFSKSNMDADAIRFMNEISSAIAAAITKATQ